MSPRFLYSILLVSGQGLAEFIAARNGIRRFFPEVGNRYCTFAMVLDVSDGGKTEQVTVDSGTFNPVLPATAP